MELCYHIIHAAAIVDRCERGEAGLITSMSSQSSAEITIDTIDSIAFLVLRGPLNRLRCRRTFGMIAFTNYSYPIHPQNLRTSCGPDPPDATLIEYNKDRAAKEAAEHDASSYGVEPWFRHGIATLTLLPCE